MLCEQGTATVTCQRVKFLPNSTVSPMLDVLPQRLLESEAGSVAILVPYVHNRAAGPIAQSD